MTDAVIIDTGCANLRSVVYACERLGRAVRISASPEDIATAQRLILPGVGAAPAAMKAICANGIDRVLRAYTRPLLGICLGMQLLYDHTEEGDIAGLGLIPGKVVRLPDAAGILPHMGWNTVEVTRHDLLLSGMSDRPYAYFVHSYAVPSNDSTIAVTDYGTRFSAVIRQHNIWGCQFHPERSAASGARILENFLEIPA